MTTDQAKRRHRRAGRAYTLALRAGLTGLQLEAYEVQAADAHARYATLRAANRRLDPAPVVTGP